MLCDFVNITKKFKIQNLRINEFEMNTGLLVDAKKLKI